MSEWSHTDERREGGRICLNQRVKEEKKEG